MPRKEPALKSYIFAAKIIAVYPDVRLVDVQWLSIEVVKRGVIVVQDSNNFSFPRVGEMGLVIGNDHIRYYYLGKIDYGYKEKLDGTQTNPDTNDNSWNVRLINAGESYISNFINGIGMLITNGGDFSILTPLNDGISYIRDRVGEPFRWLTAAAKSIQLTSTTTFLNVGAVIRKIPVLGNKIIKDVTKTKAAQEILAKVTNIVALVPVDKAKLHLGDIFIEPVAEPDAAIPLPHTELGAPGLATKVRAMLAAFSDLGIEGGSIKMDDQGNVSINAPINGSGQMAINGTRIAVGGDVVATTEQAVHGNILQAWLLSHTHSTPVGPSGNPIEPIPPTLLSLKVFIG